MKKKSLIDECNFTSKLWMQILFMDEKKEKEKENP
jgi:hypothetical protein